MKSQGPLPAVFLNGSCSSSHGCMKPYSAEPWLQGLNCTGLPVGTGPSCLHVGGGAGTANSPDKSIGSVVTFPGQYQQWKARGEAGQAAMPFAAQTTLASSTARAASGAKPSQPPALEKTNSPSVFPTSPTQSVTPSQHFTATIRSSDSAPCQTLTVLGNVLSSQAVKAILLYVKL